MSVDITGETARCSISVKDANGALAAPSTSMKVTIYDPHKNVVVNDQAMTPGVTGKYHYDYTIAAGPGEYIVLYVSTDAAGISKHADKFNVKAIP